MRREKSWERGIVVRCHFGRKGEDGNFPGRVEVSDTLIQGQKVVEKEDRKTKT